MTRHAVRFYPRVLIYEKPRPAHGPFFWDVMVDALQQQTRGNQNGARATNIVWNRIAGNEPIDFDGMPGMPAKLIPSVATSGYEIEWRSTDVFDWRHVPTAEETAMRALDAAVIQAQLDDLNETENPDDETKERIAGLESILEQLRDGGMGYKRTSYNAMGTAVSGLFWGLAAPNVPVTLTSNFSVDADESLSFRLKRLEPHELQVNHDFVLEFGNSSSSTRVEGQPNKKAKTLYAIVIGEDGNSADFVHYRNLTTAERELLVNQLNAILDFGRLTVADKKQIFDWETSIRAIDAAAKKRSSGDKKLTKAESDEKERLKKQIEDLKDSKKLTEAQEEQRRELEKKLYIAREPFKLQEKAIDLIGKAIDITVQFLRSGYVVVSVEDSRYIYENKAITSLKPPQYATMLPQGSYVTIKSNGGKFGLLYGHPKYKERASIWSQPFTIPFTFTNDEVNWNYEGDASRPGCAINFELVTIKAPRTVGSGSSAVAHPGTYQVRVDLRTDEGVSKAETGRFTPELTRAELHIQGAEVPEFGVAIWNSQTHGANPAANSGNFITDLVLQDDRSRSRDFEIKVHVGGNLPSNLAGLACDIQLLDRDENETRTCAKFSKIVSNPQTAIEDIELSGDEITITAGVGSEVSFHAVGAENFLDVPIKAPIVCNNRYPNDALRLLARDAGLPASLYANIPSGNIGIPKILRAQPGKFPDCKPGYGVTYLEFMRDVIVKKHMPGYEFWSDGAGLRISKHSYRNRPELAFDAPPAVPSVSRLCLRAKSDGSTRPTWVQDIKGYYTGCTVVGAINPLTGIRYSATETIPQATDPRFTDSLFYTGEERILTLDPDDSLKSEAACLKVAREQLNITPQTPQGLPPYFSDICIDYNDSIITGDLIRVFGLKCLVIATEFAALSGPDGQQMKLALQIAEDAKLA